MDPQLALKFGLLVSLGLVVFSLGARSAPSDAMYVLRRPQLLGRAVLSIFIIVPVLAVVICLIFPLNPAVKFALVALAVSPVPPFLPLKQAKTGGKGDYTIGLLVAAAAISLAATPALVMVAGKIFGSEANMPLRSLIVTLVTSIGLPLGVGIGLRAISPRLADRVRPFTQTIGSILLVAGVGVVVVFMWPTMMQLIGNGSILAIAALALLALAVGHFLGSYPVDDRGSLALASASRHPGVALAIATASYPELQKEATAAVLLSVLVSTLATAPYVRRMSKRQSGLTDGPDAKAHERKT